jgi:heat shock protein HtpX
MHPPTNPGVSTSDGDYEWYVRTVRRLARQADVPRPATRVHRSSAPLAYTVSDGGTPTLIVSAGLLDALSPAQAEAVLAHEVAHVANRDLRWTTRAMLPLLGAEEFCETFVDEDDSDPRQIPYLLFGRFLVAWARLGAGTFSRSRELAADLGAARATGDPGALAAALVQLDEAATEAPSTDLRAVDALNVLPTMRPGGRLLSSHPPTEERIERLRVLEREYERR